MLVRNRKRTRARRSSSPTKAYLTCDIDEGMFLGEKIVSISVTGKEVSVIVSKESVRTGKLEVIVYDQKGDQSLIGLPGESFSTSRKIWIDKTQLTQ